MKSLLLLAFGGLCGVIATVLVFTIDPNFDSTDADGAGGGNVTLTLSEGALGRLIADELPSLPGFSEEPQVEVTVGSNGIIRSAITTGGLGVGFRSTITVNPNISSGRLKLDVVDASLGELALPDQVAGAIERAIQGRLDSIAEGFDYRVTAIRTTDHRLTIEIEI